SRGRARRGARHDGGLARHGPQLRRVRRRLAPRVRRSARVHAQAGASAMSGAPEELPVALARLRTLSELGRHRELVTLARRVIASHPDDAEPWCWLAWASREIGDHASALDAAQ